jgi:hypothetical protein
VPAYLVSTLVAVGLQAVVLALSRRLPAQTCYRLTAVIGFFAFGALAGAATWWAVVPLALAVLSAVAAATEPERRARAHALARLIHADKEH